MLVYIVKDVIDGDTSLHLYATLDGAKSAMKRILEEEYGVFPTTRRAATRDEFTHQIDSATSTSVMDSGFGFDLANDRWIDMTCQAILD